MTMVGPRPLIWHVMRYYAHFGHKEFILCLGYGAHHIKDYFLNYDETASNDFVLRGGEVELLRLRHRRLDDHVRPHRPRRRRSASGCAGCATYVEGEEMFLANYADVLTDAPLDDDDRARSRQPTPSAR